MNTEFIFPSRLIDQRKSKNFSQKEVAEIIGVDLRAYQRYEYGEREPKASLVVALARLYDVSADYLLGLKDEP